MSLDELERNLNKLIDDMDKSVSVVEDAAKEAQKQIYKAIIEQINKFEVTDGRFIVTQDYAKRIAIIQKKIEGILGDVYQPSVKEYLNGYSTVEDVTIALHKSYNQLEIEQSLLTPARASIYKQAEYYLTQGLQDAYIQPAKYLLMQQVSTGISIKDSERILRQWNEGELTSGKLASGRQTPNLEKYATQIARDSIHQFNGTINDVIQNKYGLTSGIYVGDIIEDSRPFCIHMVKLKREIKLDEVPPLLEKYPQGIIPGTNKKNFPVYRGGRNCRHQWFPVRG